MKHDSTSGTANTSPVQKKRVASTLPQIDLLFGGIGAKNDTESSSFVNIDENNVTKQSVAKIREGKLSMAKLGLISTGASSQASSSTLLTRPKRFGAKFSDDEDEDAGATEYVPLREEDFQQLNESLSQSA